jgi:RecA-family ATPase
VSAVISENYQREADLSAYVKPLALDRMTFSRTWLVEGWIEQGKFYQFFGKWKEGKSLAVMDMCANIAIGANWGDRRTVESLVIYVAGEGEMEIQMRYAAWRLHNQVSTDTPFIIRIKPVYLTEEEWAIQLAEEVSQIKQDYPNLPVVIVIDTVARNFGAGKAENGEGLTDFANNILDYVVQPLNATVIAVHHTGHGDSDRGRGHSSFPAALDGSVKVSKCDSYITVKSMEMRNTASDESLSFRIVIQELPGTDNFGNPIDAAILEYDSSHKPVIADEKKPTKHELGILKAAQSLAKEQAETLDRQGRAVPDEIKVFTEDIKHRFYDGFGSKVNQNTKQVAWNRNKDFLFRRFRYVDHSVLIPSDE